MVIGHIIGGLGNQMFQYAAARALALDRRSALALDCSGFDQYRLHQGYELDRVFALQVPRATAAQRRVLLGWQAHALARRVLARPALAPLRKRAFVVEPHFRYWDGLQQAPADCYLQGYWQSERYFAHHARSLRADFAFRTPPSDRNASLLRAMGARSVSVHVRRGDYVQDARTNAFHGVCPPAYYDAAVQHIAQRLGRPEFYVFSDDAAWARQNLRIPFPCVFVDHNQGEESFNDMRLMAACQHHIIANSSFSWWGAWLAPDTDGIVIAPRRWFAAHDDTGDLLPARWTRL